MVSLKAKDFWIYVYIIRLVNERLCVSRIEREFKCKRVKLYQEWFSQLLIDGKDRQLIQIWATLADARPLEPEITKHISHESLS